MSRHQSLLFFTVSLCLILASLPPCTRASDGGKGKPLVTAITKDASTSLYTAPLKAGRPLVLDLSGPLIWFTCDASHPTLELYERECMEANRYTHPTCWAYTDGASSYAGGNKCVAHPYDPCTGRCASGELTRAALSANATDGRNPLHPVSFSAVASCAPESLLDGLPAGAAGVAGLARPELSLPAQVASTQGVARKLALCLPSSGNGRGVAILGGGPLFLLPPWLQEITSLMEFATLRRYQEQPGYFIWVKSVNVKQVPVPVGGGGGPLVVGFSTRLPYTALRRDVYRPFVQAFDRAAAEFPMPRVAAVAPFELCYNSSKLGSFRGGYVVPQIDLILEDGTVYGIFGANSMVQVSDGTVCLGFVEMKKPEELGYGYGQAPAVLMGGFQMENNLLVFDEEKQQLAFSTLLFFRQTTCSNFNFTMPA